MRAVAERITLIPSARRLIWSLRDLGYDLPAAVADLIDNSIAAGATKVDVDARYAGEDSWLRISDNGVGMTVDVLSEAMRYGTAREYADEDLGKYGLGLKTASLSQCRRLTVATKTNVNAPMQIRRWDMDDVERRDRWEVERLNASSIRDEVTEPLRGAVGTVVMWERLDRVLGYKLPGGVAAENGFVALCREIEEHLAMVFHRFLAREARRSLPLTITMNGRGNRVRAWDPYARSERATQRLAERELVCSCNGRAHPIRVQPFILPNQAQFSSLRAFNAAAGPNKWNRQQGFYIYRGDRMIQSGGWNRLRTADEHTKLARTALLFDPSADCCFEINVSKQRVLLPGELRSEFRDIAAATAARAQTAYRGRATRGGGGSGRGGASASASRRSSDATGGTARAVVAVLRRELRARPRLLARVLRALKRIDDAFADAVARDDATSRR